MAYYFWHGLDFQGSRISGAFKVPKRIDDLGTGFEKNVQYYEESIT